MILNSKLDPKKSVIGINYSSSNSSSGVVLEEAVCSAVLQMVISTLFIAGMAEKHTLWIMISEVVQKFVNDNCTVTITVV